MTISAKVICLVLGALLGMEATPVLARGGRGGGGGGGARAAGGMARPASPAINRTPSMSRPATPNMTRPNASLPATGGAAARPAGTGRPAATRPTAGAVGDRAAAAVGQGVRPTQAHLDQFLNVSNKATPPRPTVGGVNGGSGRTSLPSGGNAAIADFLQGGTPQTHSGGAVAGNRSDRISDRTDARSDFRSQRGENRNFASDNRQDRVQNRGDRQAARVDNRGEFRSGLADGRADRRTDRQQQLGAQADNIRAQIDEHYDHNHLFDDFWADHPHAHYHFDQNPVFWTWATFNTVSAFMPWNWSTGAYYDYGSGGNVYYQDNTVYANGTSVPAEQYAEEATAIATNPPKVEKPDDMEWLPLGVFGLTEDEKGDTVPNRFLQLAVSKEGILAGTYQNKTTGQTASVEGMVDKASQRAAWTIVGKNTPIFETGIANLTQNETRVLVHFADGKTQTWMMVHLENPDAASGK